MAEETPSAPGRRVSALALDLVASVCFVVFVALLLLGYLGLYPTTPYSALAAIALVAALAALLGANLVAVRREATETPTVS